MPEATDSSTILDKRANVLKSPLTVEYMAYKTGDALLPGAIRRIREVDMFLSGEIAGELGAEGGPVSGLLEDDAFTGHVIAVGRDGDRITDVAVISNPTTFDKITTPEAVKGVLAFRELTLTDSSKAQEFLAHVFAQLPSLIPSAVGSSEPERLQTLKSPTVYLQDSNIDLVRAALQGAKQAGEVSQCHHGSQVCRMDRRFGVGPMSDKKGRVIGLEVWTTQYTGPDDQLRMELGDNVSATWVRQGVTQMRDAHPDKTIERVEQALQASGFSPADNGDYIMPTEDTLNNAVGVARSAAFGNKAVQATNNPEYVNRLLNDGPVAVLQKDQIRVAFQFTPNPVQQTPSVS